MRLYFENNRGESKSGCPFAGTLATPRRGVAALDACPRSPLSGDRARSSSQRPAQCPARLASGNDGIVSGQAFGYYRIFVGKKGMTALEYALLITIFFAAILSMQVLLRRALSSKWRDAADSFGFGRQYAADGEAKTTIIDR